MADAKNAYLSMDKQKSFIILSNFKFLFDFDITRKIFDLNKTLSKILTYRSKKLYLI